MSIHINAEPNSFAKVVLMPGDPKRAEWIAETFLKNPKKVNEVRGMSAFTGTLEDGTPISVMPSGMGLPSISIYAQELFVSYGVEVIIRVGTAGSYTEDLPLKSVVIAQAACSDSNPLENVLFPTCSYSPIADFDLLVSAANAAKRRNIASKVGNVLSSNAFYTPDPEGWKKWAKMGVLAVEMEAYALYCIAAGLGKKALAVCTISDSVLAPQILTSEERQTSLKDMINVACDVARDYYASNK
jgi:purine-nucleoside phosphorylase